MSTFTGGEYEGCWIDDIVETDPVYIVWAYSNDPSLGISHSQFARARRNLDYSDGGTSAYEDARDIENDFGLTIGIISDDY